MGAILIADDNEDITDILSTYVEKEGYEPVIAKDGAEALECFETCNPQAVLLDVMMPKADGYEVCRKIRSKSSVPIILITARGEDFERIMGLDIGADDYIVKPFSPSEVMARLRAVLRRVNTNTSQNNTGNQVSIADLTINLDEYVLTIQGKKMSLTKREILENGSAISAFSDKIEQIENKANYYSFFEEDKLNLIDDFIYGVGELFSIYLYKYYKEDKEKFKKDFINVMCSYPYRNDILAFNDLKIDTDTLIKGKELRRVLTKK